MFALGWEEGGETWRWWCQLLAWEKELVEECRALLDHVILRDNNVDEWR